MKLFRDRVPPEILLDLTIASQMRPHAALKARLAESGVSSRVVKLSAKRAAEAGVINQVRIPWVAIVDYFGAPIERDSDHLTYELTLWPFHQFRFGIHPQGWVSHDGFQLVRPVTLEAPASVSLAEFRRVLHPGRDTVAEVRTILDDPRLVQGWERMEDWYYSNDTNQQNLVLQFDFGMLTGIDQRNPIVMSR